MQQLVTCHRSDCLVEIGSGPSSANSVPRTGRVQFSIDVLTQLRETRPGVTLRSEPESEHLQRRPDLVKIRNVRRRELTDHSPRTRALRDQPLPYQRLERLPHRQPAHTELSSKLTLHKPAAGAADAVDDVVTQLLRHTLRLKLDDSSPCHVILSPNSAAESVCLGQAETTERDVGTGCHG
jgi:hypothetical protein